LEADLLKKLFLNNKSGSLLICGSGKCIWDDLAHWKSGCREGDNCIDFDGDVMAINDIGMHLSFPIQHWYSNDYEMLPKWLAARRPLIAQNDNKIFTHSCYGRADFVWPLTGAGTSGLNAVFTALKIGYSKITLAGIPLDDAGHYWEPEWFSTNFTNEVPYSKTEKEKDSQKEIKYWSKAAKESFEGKVKSCSGRTKEILGSPFD
tara:strand:- start:5952 stop:6566 length:615 start_codon:yes stop_codon:yes gene_type:complete